MEERMHEKATPCKYFLHRRDSRKLLGVLALMLFSSTLLMPDSLTSVPSQKCIVSRKAMPQLPP